ncbi:hypothetical protein LTR78_002930 [Recurvomyces mirabilis]|uniref:ECO1 n=1 Tax=Recurvomyces mirabilis TaxID=574656 RepID=A0AAE1C452_9PEZI|nr:hypothetical protein LTR78_002930 [Recurvomyces mirabilis]KAK5159336.1 hypothetical protein LTS14_002478 [Recurvomyces mirabilis]
MTSSDDSVPPSTPSHDNGIFSDEPAQISSPPSSPPGFPWEQQKNNTTTPTRPAISAFSVLGKRKALADIDDNMRPTKKVAQTAESKPLSQMQISLGQKVQQKCKLCGMEYVRSSAEDRKLHDKHHKQSTEGYDVGKDFVQKAPVGTIFDGVAKEDRIFTVYCYDTAPRKRRAQAVLQIAQRDLGAVPISEEDVWGYKNEDGHVGRTSEPRYRAYMYIRKTKCIGLMLIERIKEARRVVERDAARREAKKGACPGNGSALSTLQARRQAAEKAELEAAKHPIELSRTSDGAKIGIARIWTSPTHRGQGIAVALLDTAVKHHDERVDKKVVVQVVDRQGEVVAKQNDTAVCLTDATCEPLEKLRGKEDVAFSQPTAAGARLARKWFGKLYGWHVYID